MSRRPIASLSDRLRAETGEAHQRLEDGLGLLAEPLSEDRYRRVLEGFHGFHRAWEPAVSRQAELTPFTEGGGRLALLRTDLNALGRSDAEIDALPVYEGAAVLVADRLAAIGSLYVMEGSALGGQVIARALAGTTWAPPGGLGYFSPYGAETGARWRAFKGWLDAVPQSDHAAVIAGANATFETLREWMAPAAVC